MRMNVVKLALGSLLAVCALPGPAQACSRMYAVRFGDIFQADAIVRATALGYADPPPSTRQPGLRFPESTVRFRVEEVLRGGAAPPAELVVSGTLDDRDDFNDVPLPYRFVRPGGRSGNCHATAYRPGAQYLLFLRRNPEGRPALTPYWVGLGPTNEQVRGTDDPWMDWVRAYLSPCAAPAGAALGEVPRARMDAMEERIGSDLERYRHARCYVARFGAEGSRGKRHLLVIDNFVLTPGLP